MRATQQLWLLAFCAGLAGCDSTDSDKNGGWTAFTQQHPMDGETVTARRQFAQPGGADFSGVIEMTCNSRGLTVTLESHYDLSLDGEGSAFVTAVSVNFIGIPTTYPVGRIRWNGQEPISAEGLVLPFTHSNVVELNLPKIVGDSRVGNRLPIVVALQNKGGEAIYEIPAGNEAISSVLSKCGQQATGPEPPAKPAPSPSTGTDTAADSGPPAQTAEDKGDDNIEEQFREEPGAAEAPEGPADSYTPPMASDAVQGQDPEALALAQEQSAMRRQLYAGAQTIADETGDPLFVPDGELSAPRYPAKELREGVGGVASVRIRVDAQGNVISAVIVASSRNRNLDRAAMDAVRKWRFKPVRAAEEMQEMEGTFPITFTPPSAGGQ